MVSQPQALGTPHTQFGGCSGGSGWRGRKNEMAITVDAVLPASRAWWDAGDQFHRASLRGRLATAYARAAIWTLGKLSRSDIRDPAFDWEKGRRAVSTVERPVARLASGVRRERAGNPH